MKRKPEHRVIPLVPAGVLDQCPACFTPVFWRDWLEIALSKNTPGHAAAQARVDLGFPVFPCEDCVPAFETRMQASGRCERQRLESVELLAAARVRRPNATPQLKKVTP